MKLLLRTSGLWCKQLLQYIYCRKLRLTASQQPSMLPGLNQLTGFLRKRVMLLILLGPHILVYCVVGSNENPRNHSLRSVLNVKNKNLSSYTFSAYC